MNKNGFTIMELSIAIMAIAAVAVLLLIPFKANLQEARNIVRKANVKLMTSLIKYDQSAVSKPQYNIPKDKLVGIIQENVKSLPEAESGKSYFYGYSAKKHDFFVIVCSEDGNRFIMDGSDNAKEAVSRVFPHKVCDNKNAPVKSRPLPIDRSKTPKSLDSYTVYKLF